ncbi:MAG: MATE family efflux transporter [Bacteroidales bacterium]|nr:MATE family efflux transporter [Bacteroidales bacterium]
MMPSNKEIRAIAWPIVLSLIAQNIVNVTDTAFLGRLCSVALGASAIGGLFYIAIYMLGFGFGSGAQILIARRNGEGLYAETGRIANQTLLVLFLFGVVMVTAIQFTAPNTLQSAINSGDVASAAVEFTTIRIYGLFFAFANVAFRSFYVGIAKTRLLGYSAAVMAAINVFLDYALIFGHFGLPAMGIKGAALASVVAEAAAVVFTVIYTLRTININKYKIFTASLRHWKSLKQTADVSIWVMLQNFLSLGSWFVFFIIVEKSGELNLAASNIIRSIYMVLIIPILAFATAANTLVSNSIGTFGYRFTGAIIWRVSLQGLWFVVPLALAGTVLARPVVSIYTNNTNLINQTVAPLQLVCWVMILFNMAYILFQGVSATGNTRTTLLIEAVTIVVYLIYSWMVTVNWQLSITAIWTNEYLYFLMLGILSYLYFRFGNWHHKKL